MPQTFYAVSTPILSGSVERKKLPHFANEYRDVKALKKFNYNDLISIINDDPNIKLFACKNAAIAYGAEQEIIEEKQEEETPLLNLGLAIFLPHVFAMKVPLTFY